MDFENVKTLNSLLYKEEDLNKMEEKVGSISNPSVLHVFAAQFNWDNGFQIPVAIIENDNCDLGTALMIFYNAGGYSLLAQDETFLLGHTVWKQFLSSLFGKIMNHVFKNANISYKPNFTKVQLYKLKKCNPDIPDIFLKGSPGVPVDTLD